MCAGKFFNVTTTLLAAVDGALMRAMDPLPQLSATELTLSLATSVANAVVVLVGAKVEVAAIGVGMEEDDDDSSAQVSSGDGLLVSSTAFLEIPPADVDEVLKTAGALEILEVSASSFPHPKSEELETTLDDCTAELVFGA